MAGPLDGLTVRSVVPHSPSAVGYDGVDDFLSHAEYHRRYCECATDRGADLELWLMTRGDPVGPTGAGMDVPVRTFSVTAGRTFGTEVSVSLLRSLATTDADVVHLHGYNQYNLLALAPALYATDARVVAQNHGSPLDPGRLRDRVWYRMVTGLAPWAIDAFVSVNQGELRNLQAAGLPAERSKHLPNAVDVDRFAPLDVGECRDALGLDHSSRYLLFVGRITENKGVVYLVRALARLPPDVELLLVYSGVDEATMGTVERTVEREELDDRVHFVGTVDRDRLPTYYSAADVCAFPSVNEGFGIVVLEAMACRTPVVGTEEHAAAGHLVDGETGLVARSGSVEELTAAVRRLLDGPDLASELTDTARRRVVEKYTWERVGDRLADVYLNR